MRNKKSKRNISSAARTRILALILVLTVFVSYMSPVLPGLVRGNVVPSGDSGYSMEDWMEQNKYDSEHEELDVIPDSVNGTDVSYRPPVTASVKTSPGPQTSRSGSGSASKAEPVDDEPAIVYSDDELVLTGEADGITVIVQAERDAFPESVYMQVRPVEVDLSDVVDDAVGSAESFTAIDISFYDAEFDAEIEPSKPIKVNMVSTEMLDADDAAVVHLDDEGAATVVDNTLKKDTVSFSSGEFSVYILVKKVIEKTVLASDGNAYDVTVTYTPDANIPDGSVLSVTEIDADTDEYDYAFNSVLADKIEKGEYVDLDTFNMVALDISIISPEGEEVEPEAAVQVDIRIKELPGVEDLDEVLDTIEIQHHVEVADGVVIEKVFGGATEGTYEMETEDIIVSEGTLVDPGAALDAYFESDSFSTFTVSWTRATNTSTNIRWRYNNNNTRGQVTVNYVNDDGVPIGRPSSINQNYDIAVPNGNFTNEVVFSADNVAKSISGRTYESAYIIMNGEKAVITRVVAARTANNAYSMSYYNGNTLVHTASGTGSTNYDRPDVYLQYSSDSGDSSSVIVHYVDEDGNDLPINNPENTYSGLDNSSSTPAYLIYDIEGYEYSYTYRNTNDSNNRIRPRLARNNNVWQYARENSSSYTNNLANGDNIYVVYTKKAAPAQGGNPQPAQDETWPDQETPSNKPTFSKSSLNQGDGTNLISLTIKGPEKPVTTAVPADVIVIFDVSESMQFSMSGGWNPSPGNSRLEIAKAAVDEMADALLNNDDTDVHMALVSFDTDARIEQSFTDSYSVFSDKVDDLIMPSGGRTNWERGLRLGNQLGGRENAATFVVFVTDGDPTVRDSRGDFTNGELESIGMNTDFYTPGHLYAFGNGQYSQNSNVDACFTPAVPEVKAIAEANKTVFAVGVSNDVTRLTHLMEQAGQDTNNVFLSSDAEALEEAFKSVTEAIKSSLGFGGVVITDGITNLTNAEMKVMQTVDPDSFTYYRYGGEGNKYGEGYAGKTEWAIADIQAANCGLASYNKTSGAVQWNMGDRFQLENDVTYVVTFRVWPSQEAYDLIADLNNGAKVYREGEDNSITDEEREQVVEISPPSATQQGRYSLKTNTDELNATYKRTTKTGDTVSVKTTEETLYAAYSEGTIQDMALDSEEVIVKKEFAHGINEQDPYTSIEFYLLVDGKYYQNDGSTSSDLDDKKVYKLPVSASSTIPWTNSIYIAPGFIDAADEDSGEILEFGHKYTLDEKVLVGNEFEYEFTPQTVRPMEVNGRLKYFVLVDKYNPAPQGAKTYVFEDSSRTFRRATGTETEVYYVLEPGQEGTGVLVGTNRKTAELDITKWIEPDETDQTCTLTEEQLDAETFTYRVTFTVPAGSDISGITAYEYVPRYNDAPATNRYTIFGYQESEQTEQDQSRTGIAADVERFSGKIYGGYTVTTSTANRQMTDMFTTNEDGSKTATIDITLKRKEIIRFTNLPSDTQYTITEMYNNYRQADPSRDADAAGSTMASNLAAQGYTASFETKSRNPVTGTTRTGSGTGTTITGTIDYLDVRYYNRFTNTLSNAVDVEITGTKHLDGHVWTEGERYYFNLLDDDGASAPVPAPVNGLGRTRFYLQANNDPKSGPVEVGTSVDKTYSFGKIRFFEKGDYVYWVKEDNAGTVQQVNGKYVEFGGPEKITISIDKDATGKLYVKSVTGSDNITWDANKRIVNATITNKAPKTEIKLKKVSTDGAILGGAEFSLSKYQNNEWVAVQTDPYSPGSTAETNPVSLGDLTTGRYRIKEETIPAGYNPPAEDTFFEVYVDAVDGVLTTKARYINAEGTTPGVELAKVDDTYLITIVNEPGTVLPEAGGTGTEIFRLAGLALMLISVMAFTKRRKKKSINN